MSFIVYQLIIIRPFHFHNFRKKPIRITYQIEQLLLQIVANLNCLARPLILVAKCLQIIYNFLKSTKVKIIVKKTSYRPEKFKELYPLSLFQEVNYVHDLESCFFIEAAAVSFAMSVIIEAAKETFPCPFDNHDGLSYCGFLLLMKIFYVVVIVVCILFVT